MGNDKEVRLIDANALKESLKNLKAKANNKKYEQGLQDAIDDYFPQIIDDEPTIEEEALPLQVTTSEYMLQGYLVSDDYFECPSCSYEFGKTEDVMKKVHLLKLFKELNFCPKCGQKLMRNDNGNLCYRENK